MCWIEGCAIRLEDSVQFRTYNEWKTFRKSKECWISQYVRLDIRTKQSQNLLLGNIETLHMSTDIFVDKSSVQAKQLSKYPDITIFEVSHFLLANIHLIDLKNPSYFMFPENLNGNSLRFHFLSWKPLLSRCSLIVILLSTFSALSTIHNALSSVWNADVCVTSTLCNLAEVESSCRSTLLVAQSIFSLRWQYSMIS